MYFVLKNELLIYNEIIIIKCSFYMSYHVGIL